jgi:hypothetical protein
MKRKESKQIEQNNVQNDSVELQPAAKSIGEVIIESEQLLADVESALAYSGGDLELDAQQYRANLEFSLAETGAEAIKKQLEPHIELMGDVSKIASLLVDLGMSIDEYAEMGKLGKLSGLTVEVSYHEEVEVHPRHKVKSLDELDENKMWRERLTVRTVQFTDPKTGFGIVVIDRLGHRESGVFYAPYFKLIYPDGRITEEVGHVHSADRILMDKDGTYRIIEGGNSPGCGSYFGYREAIGADMDFLKTWDKLNKQYPHNRNQAESAKIAEKENI